MTYHFDYRISVAYFNKDGSYIESKMEFYEKAKAEAIYTHVMSKYIESDVCVLIRMDDQSGTMIKSYRNFEPPQFTYKQLVDKLFKGTSYKKRDEKDDNTVQTKKPGRAQKGRRNSVGSS